MPQLTIREAMNSGIPRKTLQTVLISNINSLKQSKDWLREHGYAWHYYRDTINFHRFSQTPDIMGAHYYTKK